MTKERAIEELKDIKSAYANRELGELRLMRSEVQALEMAIKALENIGHLTDRPCSVCEFQKENGCCKWTCVFSNGLFGGMNE